VGAYIQAGETDKGERLGQDVLAQLSETDTYNRGCIEALLGHTDAALDLLDQTLQANPSKKEWVSQDPDWQSLHHHPRFRSLMGLPPLADHTEE